MLPYKHLHSARENCVLRTDIELSDAIGVARTQGFPLCADIYKNWDTLLTVETVRRRVAPTGQILDAGAENYSMVLPWLRLCGYQNLAGINLAFKTQFEADGIRYEPGNLIKTCFPGAHFDAVVCQSVIEHGIDLEAYFREMARIIKSGGILVTSTDYFPDPIDTRGARAFGQPVHIFSRSEILVAIELAGRHGFVLTGPIDLDAGERVVRWEEFGLSYTFVLLTMERTADESP